jgi:hypothetical protein
MYRTCNPKQSNSSLSTVVGLGAASSLYLANYLLISYLGGDALGGHPSFSLKRNFTTLRRSPEFGGAGHQPRFAVDTTTVCVGKGGRELLQESALFQSWC